MSQTMVEKVARALTARCGVDPDDTNGGAWDGGSYNRGKPAWTAWSDDARAAIEAMREPSEGMIKAADEDTPDVLTPFDARDIWTAMIDAALSETP